MLTHTKKPSHITPILYSLHWLPISFRIQYKVLLIHLKLFMTPVHNISQISFTHIPLPVHLGPLTLNLLEVPCYRLNLLVVEPSILRLPASGILSPRAFEIWRPYRISKLIWKRIFSLLVIQILKCIDMVLCSLIFSSVLYVPSVLLQCTCWLGCFYVLFPLVYVYAYV